MDNSAVSVVATFVSLALSEEVSRTPPVVDVNTSNVFAMESVDWLTENVVCAIVSNVLDKMSDETLPGSDVVWSFEDIVLS